MAKFTRKRIGLIFAGGTTLSQEPKQWEHVTKASDMHRWLERVPELHVVADIEPIFVTGKDATEISGPEWLAMAEAVEARADHLDGFVILHGLETIHYSANALALMLRDVPIPVVFSASPIPRKETSASQAEFGARANLINASQVATASGGGVCVVFGNRVIQGSRAQIEIAGTTLQVTSVDGSLLGQVDFGMKFAPAGTGSRKKPQYQIHLDTNVLVTTVMPGSGMIAAEKSTLNSVNGVVLRMHQGYFALPSSLQKQLEARIQEGMTVVVASPKKIPTLPASFVQLVGVSGSMAAVKTMWALGVSGDNQKLVRKLLTTNIADEFVGSGGGT